MTPAVPRSFRSSCHFCCACSTLALATSIFAIAAVGCGAGTSTTKPYRVPETKPVKPDVNNEVATIIATFDSDTAPSLALGTPGPYIGYGETGAIVLFATTYEQNSQSPLSWYTVALNGKGHPRSQPNPIASAPNEVPLAVVRAISSSTETSSNKVPGAEKDGFIALWVNRVHLADSLEAVALRPDGTKKHTVQTLTQAGGKIVWADAFSTTKGTYVLWAEEPNTHQNTSTPNEITPASAAPHQPGRSNAAHFTHTAQIMRIKINENAVATGPTSVIAENALGWDATAFPTGIALSLVSSSEPSTKNNNKNRAHEPFEPERPLGNVQLLWLDADGNAPAPPVPIDTTACAQPDVAAVTTNSKLVIAWTDACHAATAVMGASISLHPTRATTPRALVCPVSDQTLVTLLAPSRTSASNLAPTNPILVYEQPHDSSTTMRDLWLVPIDKNTWHDTPRSTEQTTEATPTKAAQQLAFSTRPALRVRTPSTSESTVAFAPSPDGFVLLVQGPPAYPRQSTTKARPIPWYVKLDQDLAVQTARPIAVPTSLVTAPDDTTLAAWSPGCLGTTCVALAASVGRDTTIFSTQLAHPLSETWGSDTNHEHNANKTPGFAPFLQRIPPAKPPLPTRLRTVLQSQQPLSSISAATVGETTFVSYLTYYAQISAPSSTGTAVHETPTGATVGLQRIDALGEPIGTPTIVSKQAVSAGGIAMATWQSGTQQAVLAWVERVRSAAHLYISKISTEGKTLQKRLISQTPSELSDIAIAPTPDGWIAAWVDWRNENGEVYAARLDKNLVKRGQEKRLTNAPGSAADVALLVDNDHLVVAYSDTRDHPTFAKAKPYVQTVSIKTLQPVIEERRVDASELHATGIQLSRWGRDIVMSWQQQAPEDGHAVGRGAARVVRLDRKNMRQLGTAFGVAPQSSGPVNWTMTCDEDACKAALLLSIAGQLQWQGVRFLPDTPVMQRGQIAVATGPRAIDVVPLIVGNAVYFVDRTTNGFERVRRTDVRWK